MPRAEVSHLYLHRIVAVVLHAGLHRHEAGPAWETDPRLKMWFHRLDALILGVIVLAVVYFVWSHIQHRVGATEVAEEAAK